MARKAAATVDENAKPPEAPPVLTEPVEIEVAEPEAPETESVETVVAPEPEAPKPAEPEKPAAEDPEKVALRQRVAEMERAEQLLRTQMEEQQRQQIDWQRKEQQARAQAWRSHYDSVTNTLGAAQSQRDAAIQEYKVARAEGDIEKEVEAKNRWDEANNVISSYTAEKNRLDAQEEQWKRQRAQPRQQQPQQPRQQQPQRAPTVEEIIATSGLPDRAKGWLRQHPDFITDQAKNTKLQEMHVVAKHQAGGQEWTDDYFSNMEELLGFKQPQQQRSYNGNGAAAPRRAPVSAPPTREAPSMSTGKAPQPTRITLNAQQREIAAAIAESRGVSQAEGEKIYAQELIKMGKLKGNE